MYKLISRWELLVFGLLLHSVYLHGNRCVDSIYMKIPYTAKLIRNYISDTTLTSAYECLELCRNHGTCKSVGIEPALMRCYLYEGRVYAGLPGVSTLSTEFIYYWLLEPECPVHLGYEEDSISKICSMLNTTLLNWMDAQSQCENDGGFLFMEDTQDSRNIAQSYCQGSSKYIYLGATDVSQEDVWEWFNGVPVNRSQFITGDPNNAAPGEHCLLYNCRGLVDGDCAWKRKFICQIPTIPTYRP